MKKKILWSFVITLFILFVCPQSVSNPVDGCGSSSYNHKTFWMPWGDHHHQGIDIFAQKGTPIRSAIPFGIVIAITHESSFGKSNLGGNTVSVLGTHGRIYYYAHMQDIKTHVGAVVTRSSVLGTVGDSGNAKGKPAHCHWSIFSLFPRFEHWVPASQRTKTDDLFKMFIVNPVEALEGNQIW